MITDPKAPGHIIAKRLAEHWLTYRNEQILATMFEDSCRGMQFWERLAVKDTFQSLVKGV